MTSEVKKGDHVFIRIVNGDMVAGIAESTKDGDITVKKAHLIMLTQDQSDAPSVSFYNYNPFCKSEEITFQNKDVLYFDILGDEISDHYKQLVSPILQPDTSKIITA